MKIPFKIFVVVSILSKTSEIISFWFWIIYHRYLLRDFTEISNENVIGLMRLSPQYWSKVDCVVAKQQIGEKSHKKMDFLVFVRFCLEFFFLNIFSITYDWLPMISYLK